MSRPGVGAMIAWLAGNEDSANAYRAATGKEIVSLKLDPDGNDGDGELQFLFTDGTAIKLFDAGRSCCESRYMHTDDNLKSFVGATLLTAEVRDGPDMEDQYYGEHECQFLVVATSKGVFTVETHNKQNGYYGGFAIRCAEVDAAD
ncbi:MAG: hypothetical protein GY832_26210 [Chloroflexi bacterium]|nr:hypothetical protein [Chloroflexota bacterium]